MTIKEALIQTRSLLWIGYRHGSGFAALEADGCKVAATLDRAVQWSALGAFQAAIDDGDIRMQAVELVVAAAGFKWHVQLNSMRHAELLEAIDKAIAMAP